MHLEILNFKARFYEINYNDTEKKCDLVNLSFRGITSISERDSCTTVYKNLTIIVYNILDVLIKSRSTPLNLLLFVIIIT